MAGDKLIEVKNLCKEFHGKKVLKNISLDINKGDVVCLIGPSGSGKSTFLRCLNKLELADSGEILFEGVDICKKDVNIDLHRRKMGMVFQQFNLFPHMTVLQNLTIAPMKLQNVDREEAEGYAMSLLEKVGLADRADEFPAKLSGGQQQRVAIVRALCMKPDVMLFDEPTSALDPELVKEVLDIIRKLKNERITMLIVSHEMNFVKEISDKVVVLENGKILEKGTSKQIFENPESHRVKEFLNTIY